MPLGTVKTNLFRAKKKLKEIVQTHEKKHGIKLYSMSWLLLLLFLDNIKALFINPETAGATISSVSSHLSSGTAGASAATGGVTTGILARNVAGLLAATLLVGGVTVALYHRAKTAEREESTVWEIVDSQMDIQQKISNQL